MNYERNETRKTRVCVTRIIIEILSSELAQLTGAKKWTDERDRLEAQNELFHTNFRTNRFVQNFLTFFSFHWNLLRGKIRGICHASLFLIEMFPVFYAGFLSNEMVLRRKRRMKYVNFDILILKSFACMRNLWASK